MFRPEADEVLDDLGGDPLRSAALAAIERTLDRLAADPYDRRLATISFVTEEYGGVCATPVRGADDWFVLLQRGPEPGVVVIILIHPLRLA